MGIVMAIGCLTAASLHAGTITLAWSPTSSTTDGAPWTGVGGYRVHYGNASRTYSTTVDVGCATMATVTNLQAGQPYYFAVSAYASDGYESDLSEELVWTPPESVTADHFSWGPIGTVQTSGTSFAVSIEAQDADNRVLEGFNGTVRLEGQSLTEITVGTGTRSSEYPLATSRRDARTQTIYLAKEIGRGGWVYGLALDVKTPPGQTLERWTLRLKPTALSSYTTKSGWESEGWSVVCQGNQAVTSSGWTWFTFSTPFYYDGTNNLMVDFSFNNTNRTVSGACRYTSTGKKRSLYLNANDTYGDPLAWTKKTPWPTQSTMIPNIRLKFGSPVPVNPVITGEFVNGRWVGTVAALMPATNMCLIADDGSGHHGRSGSFQVVAGLAAPLKSAVVLMAAAPAVLEVDTDRDGMSDSEESIAGTDPRDGGSVLRIIPPPPRLKSAEETGPVVQWSSVVGKTYRVLRSTNLMDRMSFIPIASNLPAQGPVTAYTDTHPPTGRAAFFYRIQIEP